MGTINYKTSDYITLGLKPYEREDFINDSDFKEEFEEYGFGRTLEEFADDQIQNYYECDYDNIKYLLDDYSFYYYKVKIEFGYYEGFSIDIENNFGIAFDSWEDKRDAQKEITKIREFLRLCSGFGLVECFPGWATGYSNREKTLKSIDAAIYEMRDEVKHTPTWLWYERNQYRKES